MQSDDDNPFPRIKWRIEIAECEMVPDGYGVAYYYAERPVSVCMPMPLNMIVGSWRAFVSRLRFLPWRHAEFREARMREYAWDAGYEAATTFRHPFHIPVPNPHRMQRRPNGR